MKMLKKEAEQRQAIEMLCTDMLVPKGHLLGKIDAAVNFARIYELVEDLYCEDNGRPSCDPVVLFKLVLIQHLFGIRSLRQTMRDAEVNVAYRWFLGYTMSQKPSIGQIYSRSNRRCVPVDTGGSCPGRIPVCGSRVCGWNAYQSECEPEKANEKGHTGCSETLSGATG